MTEYFNAIERTDYEKLVNAIARITILIAGADGEIDTQETEWAQKLTEIRSYNTPIELKDYYKDVGANFQTDLEAMISSLPHDTEERTKVLTAALEEVNSILDVLPSKVSYELYKSFKSFAKHVAKASGGFLKFFSISKEERNLMELEMIHPRFYSDEEE